MTNNNNTTEDSGAMGDCEGGADAPFWRLARDGVSLLLNNRQEEAEALFNRYPDSIQMYSGYATITFMDALMTFEEDKLELATSTLKETERRCSGAGGWFRSTRRTEENCRGYAEHLESQIIRADAQLYLATLTFLQQDISAYFKGAWILRKSWKHYQQAYGEVLSIYRRIAGQPPSSPVAVETEYEQEDASDSDALDTDLLLGDTSSSEKSYGSERNGHIPKSHTVHFPTKTPPSEASSSRSSSPRVSGSLRKSQSMNSALAKCAQIQRSLSRLASPINSSLAYISSLNPFASEEEKNMEIDRETITRLMCGVSFGYGLLQLGMSLLPPSILKVTHFLGFQGNRRSGLANLMYARSGDDMRAPMATLALLWYHTIVRPFFALDGNNVQAGVHAASKLLDEATAQYADSSLFLFFKGRVHRLKCDIPSAINSFDACVRNSKQREIRILAKHEVGWCHMIHLDYVSSLSTFLSLRHESRWSRAFYTYLCILSAGSANGLRKLSHYDELRRSLSSTRSGSQLDEFLIRRSKVCPSAEDVGPQYWRLLVYEILYLWNALPSCSCDAVRSIVQDCEDAAQGDKAEPFEGVASFIAGSAYCILRDFENGVRCFRNCLSKREGTSGNADDAHISAFALYELGQLLIKDPTTKAEGKQCLVRVDDYKGYDFQQRLSVRIYSILKHL